MKLTTHQRLILETTNLPLLLLLEAESINSDDENDATQDQDYHPGEQQPSEQQVPSDPAQEEAPISEEDRFSIEIDGTENKFLQFVLYDKLGELSSKIDILRDNIKNDKVSEAINLVANLNHYSQYLQVLNELIFSISTSVVYKLLGQIELELIDMLQIYNASLEQKNKER